MLKLSYAGLGIVVHFLYTFTNLGPRRKRLSFCVGRRLMAYLGCRFRCTAACHGLTRRRPISGVVLPTFEEHKHFFYHKYTFVRSVVRCTSVFATLLCRLRSIYRIPSFSLFLLRQVFLDVSSLRLGFHVSKCRGFRGRQQLG